MKKWTIRKLMISALYGEATPQEQELLESELQRNPSLRAEYDELRVALMAIPQTDPVPAHPPILPLVRSRLRREQTAETRRQRAFPYAATLAAAAALALILAFPFLPNNPSTSNGDRVSVENSLLYNALRESLALKAQGDDENAVLLLKTAIESSPNDALAGQAQMELADILFDRMKRFKEAYDAYHTLKMNYPKVFSAHSLNIARLDLLDECRKDDFEGLYLFENARRAPRGELRPWENILARYPGSRIANLAMQEMVDRVLYEMAGTTGAEAQTELIEKLRARLTNPVAIAQLNLELGKTYWTRYADKQKAQLLAQEALKSENPEVVAMAQGFLQQLGAPAPEKDPR